MSSGFMPKSAGTRVSRTSPKGTAAHPVHTEQAAFGCELPLQGEAAGGGLTWHFMSG
jgi:hypothetical protein